MGKDFIYVTEGKNSWKRYALSFMVILFFVIVGAIPYVAIEAWIVASDNNPSTYFDMENGSIVGIDPLVDFVLINSQFFFWVLGIFIAIRFIHKRKLKTLITPKKTINWRKIFWGFGVYFLLLSGMLLIDWILYPGDYRLNDFEMNQFFILALLVLVLTPIQTTAEEMLFRGYLMQWFGKRINHLLLLSIVVGVIFGSVHFFNPEMGYSKFFVGADYIFTGIMWCYITARTNSAELSIGAHAANNMLLGWFLTMDNSAFSNIPSLFVVENINVKMSLLWTVITLMVFFYFAIKKYCEN